MLKPDRPLALSGAAYFILLLPRKDGSSPPVQAPMLVPIKFKKDLDFFNAVIITSLQNQFPMN
jgi:hypothetical protein